MSRAAIAEHANVNVAEALSNFAEGYAQATAALAEANAELANCADREIRSQLQGIASELHAMLQQGVFAISPNAIRELVGELKNVKAKAEGATGADNSPQAQLRRAEAAYREAREHYEQSQNKLVNSGLVTKEEADKHKEAYAEAQERFLNAETSEERAAARAQMQALIDEQQALAQARLEANRRNGTATPAQVAAVDDSRRAGEDLLKRTDDLNNLYDQSHESAVARDNNPSHYEVTTADHSQNFTPNAITVAQASTARIQL